MMKIQTSLALSLLFALVLIFLASTEAMRWNKNTNAVKVGDTTSVQADSGSVGRTIEFLAFNDGAVGFVPNF